MQIDVLINKKNHLKSDYVPDNLFVIDDNKNNFRNYSDSTLKPMLCREVVPYYLALIEEAKKMGFNLIIDSAYRSYSYQQKVMENFIREMGEEKAREIVALPGASEHQTGLAFDIGYMKNGVFSDEVNESDKEAIWLEEHAHEFGFILRYPKGKEDITGYNYEPWHFRFVGIRLATLIKKHNITLEEYYNKKEEYDKELETIPDIKIVTYAEFLAALLSVKENINLTDIKDLIGIYKEMYPNILIVPTGFEIIDGLKIIDNKIVLTNSSSENLERISALAGPDLIEFVKKHFTDLKL